MKIRSVSANNRKAELEIRTTSGRTLPMPFSRLQPQPTAKNRIQEAYVDRELGREAVTYVLESGAEGSVHIEQALEYNEDPAFLSELLLHQLTVEALKRIDSCALSRREIARRLHTSTPQLYRLLDPTNARKGIRQMIALLGVLDCDVSLSVDERAIAGQSFDLPPPIGAAQRELRRMLAPGRLESHQDLNAVDQRVDRGQHVQPRQAA
jgi:hypothetical protein